MAALRLFRSDEALARCPSREVHGVVFPSLPGKHAYPTAYPPTGFLDALRAGGWEPGAVPESVVFTYARFELYLPAHPETYTPTT